MTPRLGAGHPSAVSDLNVAAVQVDLDAVDAGLRAYAGILFDETNVPVRAADGVAHRLVEFLPGLVAEVRRLRAADTGVAAAAAGAGAAGRGGAELDLLVLIDRYADLVAARELSAASVRARISGIVSRLGQDAEDYRLVSEEIAAKLIGDGWDDDAAEVAIVIGWAEHMAAVHPDCPGRFCDARHRRPGRWRAVGMTTAWAARYAGYLAAFQGTRLPLYAARMCRRVLWAAFRITPPRAGGVELMKTSQYVQQEKATDWEARWRADAAWLADTHRRISLRYGRVLAALAEVPTLLYQLGIAEMPEAPDVEEGPDRLTAVVQRAIGELDRLDEYAWAITEPPPAYCRTCDIDLGISIGSDGWQHWRLVDDPTLAAPAGTAGQRHEVFDPGHPPQLGYRERVPWADPDLDGPTPTTPRNDARLWARLVDQLGGGAGAERPARRLVAEVRRERGDGRTFAPGDELPAGELTVIPADVLTVYDLDGSLWDRQVDDAPPTWWRMRGFDPAEHEPAAGEPHSTAGLLDAYGPVTEAVGLPGARR